MIFQQQTWLISSNQLFRIARSQWKEKGQTKNEKKVKNLGREVRRAQGGIKYLQPKCEVKSLSCVRLSGTPRTGVHQSPPSMEFSRQEYWSGLPFPYTHRRCYPMPPAPAVMTPLLSAFRAFQGCQLNLSHRKGLRMGRGGQRGRY